MKAGDKMYCYKSFIGYKNMTRNNVLSGILPSGVLPIFFTEGEYYIIQYIINSTNNCNKIEINKYFFYICNEGDENKPLFSDYFYTLQQLRHQKLLKINK